MENQNPPNTGQNPIDRQFAQQFGQQPQQLPNSTAVLVLGIISIVGCFCYGLAGLICGIIALVLSSKATQLYNANPNQYAVSSFNNMKAGKICAIIGTSLSAAYIIFLIIYFVVVGAMVSSLPWDAHY